VTVAETERLIDAKIEEGHTLDDIVAGVQRFQKYCADTGKPSRIKPAAFVHGEKWRDDWELQRNERTERKPDPKQGKDKKLPKGQDVIKTKRKRSREFTRQIGILLRGHPADFPRGSVTSGDEIERMKQLLKPWREANPEPPEYYNKITGETWGTKYDSLPAPDWSARANGKP
jgi:hypothetical protein